MKAQSYNYFLLIYVVSAIGIGFIACDNSMTSSYDKYVGDSEIYYPNNVDSVSIKTGKNRAIIKLVRPVDPRVSKVRILWNNGQDSTDADFAEGKDTLVVNIDTLQTEGNYTFMIYTFDGKGNKSISATAIATIYGNSYENKLLNRPIISSGRVFGAGTNIQWGNADNGVIGTRIKFTLMSGGKDSILVPPGETRTELAGTGIDLSKGFQYRTLVVPDSNFVDTLYTDYETGSINDNFTFINHEAPIQPDADDYDGNRWGRPADWMINDAVKVRGPGNNSFGGFDGIRYPAGGYFNISTTADTLLNAKMYQTGSLPAGSYTFEAFYDNTVGDQLAGSRNKGGQMYLIVAPGDSLPDISNVNTAYGYADLTDANPTVSFTLTQEKQVTLGFLVNYTSSANYFRSTGVKVTKQ